MMTLEKKDGKDDVVLPDDPVADFPPSSILTTADIDRHYLKIKFEVDENQVNYN